MEEGKSGEKLAIKFRIKTLNMLCTSEKRFITRVLQFAKVMGHGVDSLLKFRLFFVNIPELSVHFRAGMEHCQVADFC
jgi:hypothetical protein